MSHRPWSPFSLFPSSPDATIKPTKVELDDLVLPQLDSDPMIFPIDLDDPFFPSSPALSWDPSPRPFLDIHHPLPSYPPFDSPFSYWVNDLPSPSLFSNALPRSFSPEPVESVSPQDTVQPPEWATQLWDHHTFSPAIAPYRSTARSEVSKRHRYPTRRSTPYLGQSFHSSSAPSLSLPSDLPRSYRRRADSIDQDLQDATIRRKKRSSVPPEPDKAESPPTKSLLRPPKLAPSAWQLYFTDWISRQQASSSRKLNVAQAAKEAGQEYATLTPEQKEPYKRRSQAAKEQRERELAAYMRTLTPEDIKRENVFRAAQRKAGKSRKSNIKDPNAPKKPLSAYFMFLQRIRSDPALVREVFGDETETTKQSVLAAAKWRSMTDDERKPFLAQAEQEKLTYEAARRVYERDSTQYGTSIHFSILPRSEIAFPVFTKGAESTSESDSEVTDDGTDHVQN